MLLKQIDRVERRLDQSNTGENRKGDKLEKVLQLGSVGLSRAEERAYLADASQRVVHKGRERLGKGVLFLARELLRRPVLVKIVQDAVEYGKVERLVRQLVRVRDPAHRVRLERRHVALDRVLVQDRERRRRQIARPLRRRILYNINGKRRKVYTISS